tara:strand:+ start:2126 stop:2233 length:108 start_codon:yes stop_codon:yes gene_type:complete
MFGHALPPPIIGALAKACLVAAATEGEGEDEKGNV